MEKVIDGITYVKQKATFNCRGCVGFENENLCEKISEQDCSSQFIFTSLTSLSEVAGDVAGVKTDTGKPQYTLIPPFALEQVAICLTEGLKTHPAKDNWKKVQNAKERFIDSMYRHAEQHRMGEVFDRDNSNVRNLSAVIVNALFALEFECNPELKGKA